jgi:hypothetical protein
MGCHLDESRNFVIARAVSGILGVVPSPVKVRGVFPALSATVIPHSQEVRFYRGDSFDLDVQVQDDYDPPNRVDISRSVMRFAAKLGFGNVPYGSTIGNVGAQILKKSYLASEIEYVNEVNGQARIKIKKRNTLDHPTIPMVWDIELTSPVEHLTTVGTVRTSAGDPIITGSNDTDFSVVDLGDIIHVEGKHVLILDVLDEHTIKTDFDGWAGGLGQDYNLYRASSKTIAGGPWTCLGDVVI